jgi:flagellar motor component MotA
MRLQKAAQLIAQNGGPLGCALWVASFVVFLATLDSKGPLIHAAVSVATVVYYLSPCCGVVAALVGIVLASLHMQPWSQLPKQLVWACAVAILWLLSGAGHAVTAHL